MNQKEIELRDRLAEESATIERESARKCCEGCDLKYFQTGRHQHVKGFIAGFNACSAYRDKRERVMIKALESSCYCDEGWYQSTEPCEACTALAKIRGEGKE